MARARRKSQMKPAPYGPQRAPLASRDNEDLIRSIGRKMEYYFGFVDMHLPDMTVAYIPEDWE